MHLLLMMLLIVIWKRYSSLLISLFLFTFSEQIERDLYDLQIFQVQQRILARDVSVEDEIADSVFEKVRCQSTTII